MNYAKIDMLQFGPEDGLKKCRMCTWVGVGNGVWVGKVMHAKGTAEREAVPY